MVVNPGAVVYGTITVGALLASESANHETYADTVGAVAIAMLVYWLAHAYTEFAEQRFAHRQPLTLDGLARSLVHEVTVIAGAAIPLAVLLVCWVAGVGLTSAVAAALWTTAAMLVVEEVVVGMRAKLSRRALMAQTGAGALFGVLVIALKLVLH
jgi:hypothetical protein